MPSFVEVIKLARRAPDARGWVIEPISDASITKGGVGNIHIVSLNPQTVRGNHYHQHRREYICVIAGRCQFLAVDNTTHERQEVFVDADANAMFVVHPKVSHAVKNIGPETAYLLCYSDKALDPAEPDITPDRILD